MNQLTPSARRVLASLVLALAPVALLVVWLATRSGLPDPIARHWNLSGDPDGFSSPGVYVGWALVLAVVVAALGIAVVLAGRRYSGGHVVAAVLGWGAWLSCVTTGDVLIASHGVADAHAVHTGWARVLLMLLISAVPAVLISRLVPPGVSRLHDIEVPEPAYRLAPGERAVWVGSASSRVMLWLALVLALAGGVVVVLVGVRGAGLIVVALVLALVHRIDVRVDGGGVSARFGSLPLPAFRTPIDHIEAARAETIVPLQWGGWGYRVGRRGTALVVRGGPGLVIARTSGSDVAITVDDPQGAADLINALRAR
jgi:hypothetical protein